MGALDGLRVLELSRFPAMTWLAMGLADHGAEVLRVPLDGPPLRAPWMRRGRAALQVDVANAEGRAAVQRLADHADVVLDDLPPDGLTGGWRPRVPPGAIRVRLPARAGTDRPGFGGPAAASAALYEPPLWGGPRYTPLAIAEVIAGLYGLVGIVAALLCRERDGLGQEVRVPLDDAVVSVLELNALFTVDAPTRWSPLRWAASPFLRAWPCAEGFLYVHAGMPHHAARLLDRLARDCPQVAPELTLSAATARDPGAVATPAEARRLLRALGRAFATRPAREWARVLADEEGLCAVPVLELADWMDHPHPIAAGHWVDRQVDGALVRQPGVPVGLSATPGEARTAPAPKAPAGCWTGPSPWARTLGEPVEAAPLEGVTVLDVTQVIAGPTAARTLAELGARVVRIENPRLTAGWAEPFHVAFNPGKRTGALDLSTEAGRTGLARLLGELRPDVVLDSFRPGVGDRLGLGAHEVRALAPGAIRAHVTAYGPGGPWSGHPGWEQTVQACTGMQARRGGDGPPELVPVPANDFATGLSGALGILLALLHRRRTGQAQRVDASLAATALHLQAPYAWRGPEGPAPVPRGPGKGWGPRCRFVRVADGEAFLEAAPGALEGVEGLEGVDPEDPDALDRALRRASVATWQARLRGRLADLAPRGRTGAVLRSPDRRTRGSVRVHEVDGLGPVTTTGPALTLSRTPLVALAPARPRGRDPLVDGLIPPALSASPHRDRSAVGWLLETLRWAVLLRLGV